MTLSEVAGPLQRLSLMCDYCWHVLRSNLRADLLRFVVMSLCLDRKPPTVRSPNPSRSASTILPHFGNLRDVRVCDGCRPAAEKHESLRLSRTPTIEDDRASVSRYRSPTATHDMPPTPTSSLRHYRPSGMRPRHSRLSTSNSLPEIHNERSPKRAGPRDSPLANSPIDEEARSVGRQRRPSQEAVPAGVSPRRSDRQVETGAAAESDEMYTDEGAQSPTLSTATAPFRRSLGDEEHPASSSESPIEAVDSSAEPSPADSPVLHGLGLDLNDTLHDDMDEKLSPFGVAAPVLPRGVSFLPAQGLHGAGERGLPALGRSDSRLSGHLIDSLPETPFDMSGIDPDVYHFDAFRAAEAMEVPLSQASTAHIQRTIRQTLEREQVPSVDAWAPVLESLLYDVADRLAMLDEVEVGNFALHDHVRVKRIPGGRPRDSEFVSGVVITKNVMLKSMARNLSNPRIMLVSFPLEYQRNDGQYLSLDKVHAQERQYLENLAVRIQYSVPHIVLAQRNVSQVALKQLNHRGIVVARHVKASALASLSHSFGAEIISSTNGLLDPRIGKCRSFRVQTFVHPKIPGGRKTFLRFEGDSRSNCTIVLRGGSMGDLAKVKRIIHTLVLVVYNAKLEGYLLHDEHVEAHVPPMPIPRGPFSPGDHPESGTSDEPEKDAPASDLTKDPELSQSFRPYEEVELTGSALVHYPPPYSLQRVAEDSRRVRELRMQRDSEEAQRILEEEMNAKLISASSSTTSITEPLSVEPTSLATPHAISDAAEEQSLASAASSVIDLQLDRPEDLARQALVDEAESAQAQHLAEWKAYSVSAPESFDLRDHQRLFVLESLLLWGRDGEPSRLCRPPEVRAIDFYRDTDTTIGQYLRKADAALQSNEPCPSPTCNEPLHRHTRVFVHDQAILRVDWESWNNDILQGAIGLSSMCRREGCHCASRLVRASAETSRLSLGRFFDLSFHPSGAFECLDESCGHDGQADHVRFWHFGGVRVSITKDKVDLRDVVAPPRQVKVRPDRQVELRNAECTQVQHRTQAFFDSVQARIASFKLDCVAPERQEECQSALAGFSERCETERRAIEELLRSTYEQAHHSNGIELINVRRALQERSHAFDADWSAFVKRIVPADFSDFRRASAQLKRIFPEAPASVSPSSRIVSGALPPAIEVEEPYDGAEPPPPSPHQVTAPDGPEHGHDPASAQVEGDRRLATGPPHAQLEQESSLAPEGCVGASGAPVQPPPLSRSSTVRARRPSTGSEGESDSTVCADGEMTATLTFSGSPFIRHQVPPIIDETSAAESERDAPPRRRRNGPQVAALVSAYESGKPQVGSGKSSERPAMRRSATERPQEAPRSRPRPSHAVSDTDSSCIYDFIVLYMKEVLLMWTPPTQTHEWSESCTWPPTRSQPQQLVQAAFRIFGPLRKCWRSPDSSSHANFRMPRRERPLPKAVDDYRRLRVVPPHAQAIERALPAPKCSVTRIRCHRSKRSARGVRSSPALRRRARQSRANCQRPTTADPKTTACLQTVRRESLVRLLHAAARIAALSSTEAATRDTHSLATSTGASALGLRVRSAILNQPVKCFTAFETRSTTRTKTTRAWTNPVEPMTNSTTITTVPRWMRKARQQHKFHHQTNTQVARQFKSFHSFRGLAVRPCRMP